MKTYNSGFRVAAVPSSGHFAALGLYIDAGSRCETEEEDGSSHFLDRMAFKVCEFPGGGCIPLQQDLKA